MQSLYDHLSANGVKLSVRRGAVRFSIHVYNDAQDVDRLLDLVKDWRKR
jgi:cysteine desulfurase/selenocysteine lyase